MSLKLLLIPFSIIMVLTITIGFIKPDIGLMQEKKSAHQTKLEQARNMNTLLSNIDALVADLNSKSSIEGFVNDYFPKEMNQGRVIDILNFLASRSGVSVTIMNLQEVEGNDMTPEESVPESLPLVTELDASGVPVTTPLVINDPIQLKTFSAQVTVKGRYENIKDFFQRLAHMNLLHKTRYFHIESQDVSDDPEKAGEVGILIGSFESDFDYFEARTGQNALYGAVFSRGVFDMTPYETMSNWVTENVPLLEKPDTGRPNPFQ